jgi:hypothetical protein
MDVVVSPLTLDRLISAPSFNLSLLSGHNRVDEQMFVG